MREQHDDTFDLPEAAAGNQESAGDNTLNSQSLTAAMMSAESDVELPGSSRPASGPANLLALKIGENYTKSLRVPSDVSLDVVSENIMRWKAELRASMNQSIRQARRSADRTFSMETLHTVTATGVVYLQVIATRTA